MKFKSLSIRRTDWFIDLIIRHILRNHEFVSLDFFICCLSLLESLLKNSSIVIWHPRSSLDAWQNTFHLIIFALLLVISFTNYTKLVSSRLLRRRNFIFIKFVLWIPSVLNNLLQILLLLLVITGQLRRLRYNNLLFGIVFFNEPRRWRSHFLSGGLFLVLLVRGSIWNIKSYVLIGRWALNMIFKGVISSLFRWPLISLIFLRLWSRLNITTVETCDVILILKQKLVSILFFSCLNSLDHLSFVALDSLL